MPTGANLKQRKSPARDASLDLLKCVLVLGVILFHSGFQRISTAEKEIVAHLQHFFSFVVLGFFWSAGYLMKPDAGSGSWAKNRGVRLLLPFLAVSMVNWLAFLLAESLSQKEFGYAVSAREFLEKILTLQGVGPQMYFLPYLFFLQLAAGLVERVIGESKALWLVAGMLLVGWMFLNPGHLPLGPAIQNLPLYLAALFLGMGCREWPAQRPVPTAPGLALAVLAGCAFLPVGIAHALCCFLAPGLLYFSCRRLGAGVRWPGKSGDIFSVFIWHTPLLLPFFSILFTSVLPIPSFALIPTILCATGVSVLLGRILGKTSMRAVFGAES